MSFTAASLQRRNKGTLTSVELDVKPRTQAIYRIPTTGILVLSSIPYLTVQELDAPVLHKPMATAAQTMFRSKTEGQAQIRIDDRDSRSLPLHIQMSRIQARTTLPHITRQCNDIMTCIGRHWCWIKRCIVQEAESVFNWTTSPLKMCEL